MLGTYTAKKRKAKLFGGESANDFLVALLEAAFDAPFDGTLSTKKLKMTARFSSQNGQDVINVKLKAKALVDGRLNGQPIVGKARLNVRGSENRGLIHLPLVLRPVRNSEEFSTNRSNAELLSLFSTTQEIWQPAGIIFDVTVEETKLSTELIEIARRDGISSETLPIFDAIPDPGKALHMFFLNFTHPKGGFVHSQELSSENRRPDI